MSDDRPPLHPDAPSWFQRALALAFDQPLLLLTALRTLLADWDHSEPHRRR